MPGASETDSQLEIAHVLFIDIVGYSKLPIDRQSELLRHLNQVVRGTEQFRLAEAAGKLVRLPTGDGMALAFFTSPDAPVRCALEIAEALKSGPEIKLRMGVDSGPVDQVSDVNDHSNVAGAGINMAQRVMDCGDAGHILLSKRVAGDLGQYSKWQSRLHDLGEVEVKHGVRVSLVNLYTEDVRNAAQPEKLQRVQREHAAAQGRGAVLRRRKMLLGAAAALVLASAIATLWLRVRPASSGTDSMPPLSEKSIAVLPFENLSDDKENAFFADGIHDDLITALAKIRDLKVIGRASVMGYRGATGLDKLREIGQALSVRSLLEGSVRRAGERIIVSARLLDPRNGRQLWGETYDRTPRDTISLQGELAREIAGQLHATVTPEERARLERRPTENADAYALYLRALSFARLPTREDKRTAAGLFEQVTALDPSFALAWAQLSFARYNLYGSEKTDELKAQILTAARETLRLRPDQSEGHRAIGNYHLTNYDFPAALEAFQAALKAAPNDPGVIGAIAIVRVRQGDWIEGRRGFELAAALSPQQLSVWENVARCARALRDWPAVVHAQERLLALAPDVLSHRIYRARTEFEWKGDLAPLKAVLATVLPGTDSNNLAVVWRYTVAMYERDYATAESVLLSFPGDSLGPDDPKRFRLGLIYRARRAPDDDRRATLCFAEARQSFEALVQKNPRSAPHHVRLGLIYAFLGWRAAAAGEMDYATALCPPGSDAVDSAEIAWWSALTYASLGEADAALPIIEHLLAIPTTEINIHDLRLDPIWDNLRPDSRFAAVIARPDPTSVLLDRAKQAQ